jgi:response regulator of citrate/malate metabolism
VLVVNVLVVEDEPTAARALVTYVERVPGFQVVGHARTGADALRRIAAPTSDRVDLLMLDIYLPDMTGLEVLRRIRAAGSVVDVIAVTVARDLSTVKASLSLGVAQYLLKPFTFKTVRQKLERYSAFRSTLTEHELILQQEIDNVLSTLHADLDDLPKGIGRESLGAVVTALREHAAPGLSAAELADVLGASRVTARRYLEYLVDAGLVHREARYGGSGRPEFEYRWHPGSGHGSHPAGRS